jgi:hypothetical protein
MAGVITRSNHPDALWPGIKAWYGKNYDQYAPEWSQIFEKRDSDKAYEKVVETTGFGLAAIKGEGASISYDSDLEGTVNTFTHVVYGLGYIVTEEELEDNLYTAVSRSRSKALSMSMRTTQEIIHANILNRATSGSYTGGDGVALASASHPTLSGNQSNLLTGADLSESSIEDALKTIARAKNARGLQIAIRGQKLIVSSYDMFNAERILKSQLRVGTANNDINAIKNMGLLPEGVVVNHYLTDVNAWGVQTNVQEGLMSFWRREPALQQDNDFDTSNAKAKSTMRFAAGWADFRSLFWNAGSS